MSIEEINNNSIKFNTCRFRSEEPITRNIKRCSCQGGDYELTAFFCYEREIFEVNEEICKECPIYQSK